jgi:glycosyltransferase involved in cell wall biosynthesis
VPIAQEVMTVRDVPGQMVSVVMAAHDAERHLVAAVESVLEQTYRDLALIVVDDASADSTWQMLQQLARSDDRMRLLRNERCLRVSASLNRGIRAATGRYVAIMDHDDIAAPERIEKQAAYLEQHPQVGVVGCLVDAFDQATGTRRTSSGRTDGSWLEATVVMAHPTMLMRRDLFARHGLYDDRYDDACDYELQSRFASRGVRMHVLEERLYLYRVHSGSMTALRRNHMIRTSLRVSARSVFGYRRMLTARGWRRVARDVAILAYLSLGLRRIMPPAVGKRLWPA